VLQLLDSVGSVDTVRSVLKHILDLVTFTVPFPKLSNMLLKVLSTIAVYFPTIELTTYVILCVWILASIFFINSISVTYSANECNLMTCWQLFDNYEWFI